MSAATDQTTAGADRDPPPPSTPERSPWRPRYGRLLEGGMLPLAFGLLVLAFGIDSPNTFPTIGNFSNIFGSYSVYFVLALALLVPLTNGDIDLSVGAVSGLVTMIIAVLNVQDGIPIVWCCLIGLASGTMMGWFNGQVVMRFDVNPFIITLGTGYVFTGIGEWLCNEQTIGGISPRLTEWTFTNQFLRIPVEFYYGLGLMLVLWYVLTFTPFGQRALFVGESRDVARLSGFRVNSIRIQGFVIAGFIAALSGILAAGTSGSASPDTGTGLLLPAYAAVFLGFTTIQPGRFNAIGTGIALYFLATGVSGLELLGAQNYVQELFYGAVLVIAVVISRVVSRHRTAVRT